MCPSPKYGLVCIFTRFSIFCTFSIIWSKHSLKLIQYYYFFIFLLCNFCMNKIMSLFIKFFFFINFFLINNDMILFRAVNMTSRVLKIQVCSFYLIFFQIWVEFELITDQDFIFKFGLFSYWASPSLFMSYLINLFFFYILWNHD